jgi:hypothetical protein
VSLFSGFELLSLSQSEQKKPGSWLERRRRAVARLT